jgi:predicted RNase H-like HicB family nuclease
MQASVASGARVESTRGHKAALALPEQHTKGRPRPEPEGGFTVTCPKLPPVVTYGETLEEAQANAREAIGLCLEAMREDGQPIPPPDRDLASPIDQLVAVADADA